MPRQPQGPFAVIASQPDSAPFTPFAPLIQTLNRLLAQSEGPPCADQHKPSFLCPFSTARFARGSLAKSIRPYQKEERIPAGEKGRLRAFRQDLMLWIKERISARHEGAIGWLGAGLKLIGAA